MITLMMLLKFLTIVILIPGSIPAIIFGLSLLIKKYTSETLIVGWKK